MKQSLEDFASERQPVTGRQQADCVGLERCVVLGWRASSTTTWYWTIAHSEGKFRYTSPLLVAFAGCAARAVTGAWAPELAPADDRAGVRAHRLVGASRRVGGPRRGQLGGLGAGFGGGLKPGWSSVWSGLPPLQALVALGASGRPDRPDLTDAGLDWTVWWPAR